MPAENAPFALKESVAVLQHDQELTHRMIEKLEHQMSEQNKSLTRALDNLSDKMEQTNQRLIQKIENVEDKVDKRLGKLMWLALTATVTFSTAILLVALDIAKGK